MWLFISLCRFGEFSVIITLSNYFKQFSGFFFSFFRNSLPHAFIGSTSGVSSTHLGSFTLLFFSLSQLSNDVLVLALCFFLSLFQYNYFWSSLDSFFLRRAFFLHPKFLFQCIVVVMISPLILIYLAYCFPNFIRCLCLSICSSLRGRAYWIFSQAVCNSISFGSVTCFTFFFFWWCHVPMINCEFYGFVAGFSSIK